MSLRLFTIVLGDRYLDWFERACCPSLCWPRNRAALADAEAWDIWTTPGDADRARAAAERLGVRVEVHDEMSEDPLKDNLYRALRLQLKISRDNAFLFAAPDNVFGDGTVGNLLRIGAARRVCVAVAPLRVDAETFPSMGPGPLSNPQLVRLAFRHLHETFRNAEVGRGAASTAYRSGVSWRTIGDGLHCVTHRLPSAYLMQPTTGDYLWFKHHPKFGWYDHWFPQILVEQERQRVIGSSDAAFVVELTPRDVGRVSPEPENRHEPDRFIDGKRPHYIANRNVAVIWREGD